MKFEIDIENSTLSEYFYEEDGDMTVSDVFKEAVLKSFVNKIRFDDLIRKHIKDEISVGLHSKIIEYKNDIAIKVIVEDVIREELSPLRTGSFFYLEEYRKKVKDETIKLLGKYTVEINRLIENSVREQIKKEIEDVCKDNHFIDFIDKEKLSKYLLQQLKGEKHNEKD